MEITRKLATMRYINKIEDIPDADNIKVATIDGWKVVVKKDEFKEGDPCIYFEIDSILPVKPCFEFMAKYNFRLKTIRLRKQISQGLVMPIFALNELLPEYYSHLVDGKDVYIMYGQGKILTRELITEDTNLTELLGVTKYEPQIPAELGGKVKGNFPQEIPKTDEERVQNSKRLLYKLIEAKAELMGSEKLDGSSATFALIRDEFVVCSRNMNLIEYEGNTFWKVARELDIENKMRAYATLKGIENFSLQGELIGEGIQKNKYALKGQTVRMFKAFNIDTQKYFDYETFVEANHIMNLETVPFVVHIPEITDTDSAYYLQLAEDKSVLNGKQEREGIVFMTVKEHDFAPFGILSFKAISNKFLLKED